MKVYIDPTTIRDISGLQLGVKAIETENSLVFQEGKSAEFGFGILLIVIGVASSVVLYLLGQKK